MTGTPPSALDSDVRSLPPTAGTVVDELTVAFTEIVVPGLPVSEVRTA